MIFVNIKIKHIILNLNLGNGSYLQENETVRL